MSWLTRFLGDPNQKYLKKIQPLIEEINQLEKKLVNLSDEKLNIEIQSWRSQKDSLDQKLPLTFALVREAAKRTLHQRPFNCQLQAGIALHQGKVIEMKTGEGKTLAATLPATLNALEGKGVHLVTVNDYLARRDAVWMGQIYHRLGLTVGVLNHEQSFLYNPQYQKKQEDKDKIRDSLGSFQVVEDFLEPCSRKEAYQADITYGTNNEFGFDYLRDNLIVKEDQRAQREFHYAIIDEADSILIDEARTPLIISQPQPESTRNFILFSKLASHLKEGSHYNVDRKRGSIALNEEGISEAEKGLGLENLYHPENETYLHHLRQALKAKELFLKDEAYVVRKGEVILVDEFTGRLMPGRRYNEGLHQAIEAKEGLEIKPQAKTLATITLQNYFRMYKKLSGMTGTALSAAEEFDQVYRLDTKVIPPHRPMIRQDLPDKVFVNEASKLRAVVKEVKKMNEKGRPVLVGTTSIEKNEYLSKLLGREGISHQVLNAKHHEEEGQIIAQAGRLGKVTIATNMAGRGVDIVLGGNPSQPEERKKVMELGGLFILGTERHEARRIDNQLRGRSGRQGEPGAAQFYLSLKNEVFPEAKNIIQWFGGERIEQLLQRFHFPEDEPIENRLISQAIESAQRKIEGMNFDFRKRLLEYDNVVNQQRQAVYRKRTEIIQQAEEEGESLKQKVLDIFEEEFRRLVSFSTAGPSLESWNLEEIFEEAKTVFLTVGDLSHQLERISKSSEPLVSREEIIQHLLGLVKDDFEKKEKEIGRKNWLNLSKLVLLRLLDELWSQHLSSMDYLRESVGLRAYAQKDPLVEYKEEGYRMFQDFMLRWKSLVTRTILKVQLKK
jgi:preprotein translocase subunit SecA